jgi:predicted ATPase/class 3 adenylate cyclase
MLKIADQMGLPTLMMICRTCGRENPEGFRFCGSCGTSLSETSDELVRKIVSVVFCDIAGSTDLGEGRDPESIRLAMDRYFAEMRAIVERHGGIVEKFVGDAVMAAFGIPVMHEDDALRAARAVLEMQRGLETLNDELEAAWGIRLQARIGVNTGHVVAGDPAERHTFATGDTVNTAARLEQSAPSGHVLLGETTYRLIRGSARAEPVEPLQLKGKAERVRAYRLVEVVDSPGSRVRPRELRLVGRDEELQVLHSAFDEVRAEGSIRLVTVVGAAGEGKSRLLEQFATGIRSDATIVRGRCLSYGQGVTFWPIVEIIRAVAGIASDDDADSARGKIAALVSSDEQADLIVAAVSSAIDLGQAQTPMEQVFWAVRRTLEEACRSGPVIVLLDDLQWAEPSLFDLLDHVLDFALAPILLVCMARPDLWDTRPSWGGSPNGSVVTLSPLPDEAGEQILAQVLDGAAIDPHLRDHVLRISGGNPLFVEELVGSLIESGRIVLAGGTWTAEGELSDVDMPTSIEALLGARLERLPARERSVLERASIVGQVFYESAVGAMFGDASGAEIAQHLESLEARALIWPSDEVLPRERAFRFRHLLFRDAAYAMIGKALRAKLHVVFAAWLERMEQAWLPATDELAGYHLEQAVHLRAQLGPMSEEDHRTARRAAELLASGAERALTRSDVAAAAGLLSRATSLVDHDDPWRLALLPKLGRALAESGRLEEAIATLTEAVQLARANGDVMIEAMASLALSVAEAGTPTQEWTERAMHRADVAFDVLAREGNEHGLAQAHEVVALSAALKGNVKEARNRLELAAISAERAGDMAEAARYRSAVTGAAYLGPDHAERAVPACEAILPTLAGFRAAEGNALANLGALYGLLGDIERARALIIGGTSSLLELGIVAGQVGAYALRAARLATVETLVGDLEMAERELHAARGQLVETHERFALTTVDAYLAGVLCDLGRVDEAEEAAVSARDGCPPGDEMGQAGWRVALARVLARRGDPEDACDLAREAVAIMSRTEYLLEHAATVAALAEVLSLGGRAQEATVAATDALKMYRRKGVVAHARPMANLMRLMSP